TNWAADEPHWHCTTASLLLQILWLIVGRRLRDCGIAGLPTLLGYRGANVIKIQRRQCPDCRGTPIDYDRTQRRPPSYGGPVTHNRRGSLRITRGQKAC